MNISQHAFVPRTTIRRNSAYSNTGSLQFSENNDVFSPQLRFGANYSLLCQYFASDSQQARHKVYLFDPFYRFGTGAISANRIFPLLPTSESIAFGNNFAQFPFILRGMVMSVTFTLPFLSSLSLNSVDDEQR